MEDKKQKGFLGFVERVGNKLPHPIYIFLILTVVVAVVSAILSGYQFKHPGTGEDQIIKSLLSADGLRWLMDNLVKNFTKFAPLGMVLVMMIGLGLAEETGLIRTSLRSFISGASSKAMVTFIVLFAGVMGNIAGSSTFVVIPPLGAIVFKALGRNPLAGICAGFGGVAAGLSANLLVTPTDVLSSGITQSAAQIINPNFTVHPAVNWYFMFVSTFVLSITGSFIINHIIEPRLGTISPEDSGEIDEDMSLTVISQEQKHGLKNAMIATIVYVILLACTIVPKTGILRDPKKGTIVPSPFLSGMIPILLVWFVLIAIVYGITAGTIKSSRDIEKYMTNSMKGFSGFIVLCFFAAQFVESFSYTNLGMLVSVKGGEALANSGLVGIPLIILFILFVAFVNFFIGSSSAKWALLAPIFVPMFMNLGFSPMLTQAAYRIADSVTNCISPLEPFMPYIIILSQKYYKKAGLGTVISMMLPIAIGFLVVWSLTLVVWYAAGLPLGPGAPIFLK